MPFYDFWKNKGVTPIGQRWSRQAAEFTLGHVQRHVNPLRHVVEIGPGRGPFTNACHRAGIGYTAVDANPGLLHALDATDGICSFVPPLPIRNVVCDAAVANHVLEHVNGLPQAQAMIAEMRRIVRPGGCVAITSPDLMWVRNYFWDCDYSHNFPTSARRLYQLFLDQGLEVVYLGYVHNHLTGLVGHIAGSLAVSVPYSLPFAQPNSSLYSDQIYKARLTFSRAVLIIGRCPLEAV